MEIACQTPDEFIEKLRWSESLWGPREDHMSPWLFRGQGSKDWKLQASAWREDGGAILEPLRRRFDKEAAMAVDQFQDVFDYSDGQVIIQDVAADRRSAFARQLLAEIHAVREFIDLADSVGLPVPASFSLVSPQEWLKYWTVPLFDLEEDSRPLSTALALAQHHGVPTRLVDWTRDPLKAAYFAACSIPRDGLGEATCSHLAVWAVHSSAVQSSERFAFVTCERYRHAYLHAQDAVTVLDNRANNTFLRTGQWPTLEEALIADHRFTNALPPRKLTLPTHFAKELLARLWLERVSVLHLMPTLDNVSRALKEKWSW